MKQVIAYLLILWLTVLTSCDFLQVRKKPMSEGERLYRAKCRSCHVLPDPQKYSDDKWVEIVEHYGQRARLSADQKKLILRYLQSNNE